MSRLSLFRDMPYQGTDMYFSSSLSPIFSQIIPTMDFQLPGLLIFHISIGSYRDVLHCKEITPFPFVIFVSTHLHPASFPISRLYRTSISSDFLHRLLPSKATIIYATRPTSSSLPTADENTCLDECNILSNEQVCLSYHNLPHKLG